MTYYTLKTNPSQTSYLLQKSTHSYSNPNTSTTNNKPRTLSPIGSDSYKRSLRRAFSRAKLLAFFNPDLTQFITFTYKQNITDEKQALKDIKYFLKQQKRNYSYEVAPSNTGNSHNSTSTPRQPIEGFSTGACPIGLPVVKPQKEINPRRTHKEPHENKTNPFKYIYVFERQKRGAIHVHMVANDKFAYEMVNGHKNVKYWPHGFTDVLTINDVDTNFKPYLYLFKYMSKAQRIGSSFIHCSRNFDKITNVDYDKYIDKLMGENILYKEDYEFKLQDKTHRITKEYFRTTQNNFNNQENQL